MKFPIRSFLVALGAVALGCMSYRDAYADPAAFDLVGPDLTVTVTRAGKTLPLGQVPNLAAGDPLFIRADLPATQSAHYLLIAGFLRGSTNPPPSDWFFKCETWAKTCAQE